MNTEWHELIQRYIAGTTTAEEAMSLQQSLKTDAKLRTLYLDYVNLDVALEAKAEAAEMIPDSRQHALVHPRHRNVWLQWRPVMAAAAGIVFGILCTSVVFAYVAPLAGKAIQLLQESFESGPAPMVTGVPVEAGLWSGDYSEVVGEQQGVKPAGGKKMLRFLRADYEGKTTANGYVADLYQLIDLRPYRSEFADVGAVLQFSAGFNAFEFPANDAYGCLMSMHALDAEMVRNGEMSDRQELNAEALAMTSSNRLMLDRDPATWQRQTAELRLPPNTEYLLIHVAVSHATKSQRRAVFDGHYLDDVRLVLTRRAPLP
jgi:hypothetical protein